MLAEPPAHCRAHGDEEREPEGDHRKGDPLEAAADEKSCAPAVIDHMAEIAGHQKECRHAEHVKPVAGPGDAFGALAVHDDPDLLARIETEPGVKGDAHNQGEPADKIECVNA